MNYIVSCFQQGKIPLKISVQQLKTVRWRPLLGGSGANRRFATWSPEFAGFSPVPQGMLSEIVMGIRKRKGLKEQIPTPKDYLD
ncbi:hypothetical protein SDC9_17416 [bioreactor metagenome]|uniref:Uncharacterized protein n=1 Tax=bioreactor metagenome TaxID=1076179 RepID=A0A644TYC2_9ZZZZ